MVITTGRIGRRTLAATADADTATVPACAFTPARAGPVLLKACFHRPNIQPVEHGVHARNPIHEVDHFARQFLVIDITGKLDDTSANGFDIDGLLTRCGMASQPANNPLLERAHVTPKRELALLAELVGGKNTSGDGDAR